MVFPVVSMDVRVGQWRKLSTEEMMLLNCGVGEDSWESLGLHGDPTKGLILKPPDMKNWLIGKDPNAGMTEDEMVGWHHGLNGHEFGQTPGVDDGQGGLVCCSSWGCKESDTTDDWTDLTEL